VTAYVVRRLFYSLPLILGVALIVFLVFDSGILGDPAIKLAGKNAKPERIAEIRHAFGYDDPVWVRFGNYLWSLVTFEFGRSRQYNTQISEMIRRGVVPSLTITVPAFAIATVLAVSMAVLCAVRMGRAVDRILLVAAVALMSVSAVVYIIFGQWLFAYKLRLLPVQGYEAGPQVFAYVALPIAIWVALSIAPDLRFYRTAMLEEVRQDYVRTARAKGLPESKVLFKHVLRNAMIPILTRVMVVLPFLFTGALLLEQFFGVPGLGFMVIGGIAQNDMPVIRALTFIFALGMIVATLLTDILYTVVDPRVRLR
jgi:peptide/nickel transport system permease protein